VAALRCFYSCIPMGLPFLFVGFLTWAGFGSLQRFAPWPAPPSPQVTGATMHLRLRLLFSRKPLSFSFTPLCFSQFVPPRLARTSPRTTFFGRPLANACCSFWGCHFPPFQSPHLSSSPATSPVQTPPPFAGEINISCLASSLSPFIACFSHFGSCPSDS